VQLYEVKKQEGNNSFSAGKYQEAFDLYSECLQLDPLNQSINSTLHANRAAAAIKVT
jgi:DnaJ family protein C protein 7